VDLEKFFDRVNHDLLMGRLARRIDDTRLLRLIRRYLNAGMMADGVVVERLEGTPQGGPLSPLLANLLLDEVDKELEQRGHAFVRYADDCNVYVRSRRAGERVMAALERMYTKLRLKVNRAKSKVELAHKCSLLSYSFWYAKGGTVLCRVADTPKFFAEHDKWIRHRLRALQLKQWKRGSKIYAEMRRLGLSDSTAAQAAAVNKRWWSRAAKMVHAGLSARYYDRIGVPRLAD
jgi:RNA-directed DNA polymerase